MAKTPQEIIEDAVGELYRGFYQLRQSKQFKEEYDSMGSLMNMLQQDRAYIRKNYLGIEDV
jgi:hypothetical protein